MERYLREIPAADGLDVLFVSHLERAGDDADTISLADYARQLDDPAADGAVARRRGRHQQVGAAVARHVDHPAPSVVAVDVEFVQREVDHAVDRRAAAGDRAAGGGDVVGEAGLGHVQGPSEQVLVADHITKRGQTRRP